MVVAQPSKLSLHTGSRFVSVRGRIGPRRGRMGAMVGCHSPGPVTRHRSRLPRSSTFAPPRTSPKHCSVRASADQVWSALMRGDLDEAVFKAFKAVEVGVRAAGGYANTDIGVTLMRKAFDVDRGPLTRLSDPAAERQALSDLFAGAIGSWRGEKRPTTPHPGHPEAQGSLP